MAIQPDPTPEQEWEWLLEGLLPLGAVAVVEADIDRYRRQVERLQVKMAEAYAVRKKIQDGEWPTNDEGFLTYSSGNPLKI